MFPFFLPAWESDATVKAALEQSVASSVTAAGQAAALTGGEGSVTARTLDPSAAYDFYVHGLYAHLLNIAVGSSGVSAPADNGSGDLSMGGTWVVLPETRVHLDTRAFIANELGVRAFDELAQRDPFLTNRVEYSVGGDAQLSQLLARRLSLTLTQSYLQSGAVTADLDEAKGIDLHLLTSDALFNYELGKLDVLQPEVTYSYGHYFHALLDTNFDRGPADIQAVSGILGEQHAFARRLYGTIAGGVTVATAPPILAEQRVVVAPLARASIRYESPSYRVEASYQYMYTSLGPAVGYGHQQSALLDVATRPVDGRKWRDLVVHGIGRLSYGSADVAANPTETLAMTVPTSGTLTTWAAAVGAVVEYPIARGLAMTAGVDIEYEVGLFSPAPVEGQSPATVTSMATIGLQGIVSTDKRLTVRPDPQEEDERKRDPFYGASADSDTDHVGAPEEPPPAKTLQDEVLTQDGQQPTE